VILSLAALVAGCGDSLTEVESISDLAGTWSAIHVKVTLISDPSQRVEWVPSDGGSISLIISADGQYRWELIGPGDDSPHVDRGTVRLSGSNLILTGSDWVHTYAFTLTNGLLSLVGDIAAESGDWGFTSEEYDIMVRQEIDLRRIRSG
jgi:hypothetical protein